MGFLAETNLRYLWRFATGYAGSRLRNGMLPAETEAVNALAIDRESSVTVAVSIQET
jgi:hypothetical protein